MTSVELATAISENASTIARTQTINLLRESFFRTCERFLNDSQMTPEMLVQAARDQRMMVSVLAIEQLTGSVTPPPVRITTTANATVSADAAKMMERLDAARAEMVTAETAAATLGTAAAALESSNGCKAIREKPEAQRNAETEVPKLKECDAAQVKAKDARAAASAAKTHYEALRSVAGVGGAIAANTGGASEVGAVTGGQPTTADRIAVADTVERIVRSTFEVDEYAMLCIRVLSDSNNRFADLTRVCTESVKAGIERELIIRAQRNDENAEVELTNRRLLKVENYVVVNGEVSAERLKQLWTPFDGAVVQRFKDATTVGALRTAYLENPRQTQLALAERAESLSKP